MLVHGIKVCYNGKINSAFYPPDWDVDYNVGEMLLDVYEFNIEHMGRVFKDALTFDGGITEEGFEGAVDGIMDALEEIGSVVMKSAFLSSLYSSSLQYAFADEKRKKEITKTVTLNEFLEACWTDFLREYEDFKWFFEAVIATMNEEATEDQRDVFSEFIKMFRDGHHAQTFEYEIITDPGSGEFMSVYTINSLLSLLAFEFSHMKECGVAIKRCKNCGRYFIPEKRNDTIYCQWPSPQDSARTCRQIGAQIAMQNKLNEDETAKAYRKKYQSLNMAYQRETDLALKKRHLEKRKKFMTMGKSKKKELNSGNITAEEFIEWCEKFL